MEILTAVSIGLLFMANIWSLMLVFVCDHPAAFAALAVVILIDYLCIREG